MIDVTCPQCRAVYHSEPAHIGKHIKCTKCGFLVPVVSGSSAKIVERRPAIPDQEYRAAMPRPSSSARSMRRGTLYSVALVSAVIAISLASLVYSRHSVVDRSLPLSRGQAGLEAQQPAQLDIDRAAPEGQRQDADATPGGLQVLGEVDLPTEPRNVRRHLKAPAQQSSYDALPQGPSLPNGARMAPDVGVEGYGVLNVNNGTSEDAEVILYSVLNDEIVRDINVKSRNFLQITGIPAGTYELKYAEGHSFHQFGQTLDYTERRREERGSERIEYDEISVTLHPIVGGNVRTKGISREEFLKGHRSTRQLKAKTGSVFPPLTEEK
jgi:hypothetical protein